MKGRELLFIIKARNAAKGAIQQFRNQLDQIRKSAKGASDNIKKVGKEARAAAKNVQAVGKGAKGVTNLNKKFKQLGASIKSTAKSALSLKGALIGFSAAFIGREVISILADFSDEMAKVRGITGATTEEFARLEEQAINLGTTTRFSATEAAEAMAFLARAGFNAVQVLEAVPATLQLAQAGALDLGRAADIVSNIMSAFGIETSRTTDVVDVLAIVATSTNTSVQQLGDAMSFAAPLAAALGVSVNETAAALGALGNIGIQGGRAGAGLGIFIQRLLDLTPKATKALERLGFAAADLNPQIVSLPDIIDKLADSTFGASEAVRVFGARGARVALGLKRQREEFKKTLEATKNAGGAAKELARIFDETFGGAIKSAISALQGLILRLGQAGLFAVLEAILRVFTSVVRGIASFVSALSPAFLNSRQFMLVLQGLLFAVAALLGGKGLLLLAGSLGGIAAKFLIATGAAIKFTASLVATNVAGFITALTSLPTTLLNLSRALLLATTNMFRFIGSFIAAQFASFIAGITASIKAVGLLSAAFRALSFALVATGIGAIIVGIGALIAAFVFLGDEVFSIRGKLISLNAIMAVIGDLIFENVVEPIQKFGERIAKFFDGLLAKLQKVAGLLGPLIEKIRRFLFDDDDEPSFIDNFLDRVVAKQKEFEAAAKKASTDLKKIKSAAELADDAMIALTIAFDKDAEAFKSLIGAIAPGLKTLQDLNEQEDLAAKLVKTHGKFLAELGITQKQAVGIQERLKQVRAEALQPLIASNRILREEISLIGLEGLALIEAQDQIAEARRRREASPLGALPDEDPNLRAQNLALKAAKGQQVFLESIKDTIREQRIEAALIGRTEEDVERLTLAIEVMDEAKKLGFDPTEVKALGEEVVKAFDEIQAAIDKFNEDGVNGVKEAFAIYIEEAENFADQFERVTTKAIRGMEDALTEFITKGKLDFKSLIDSIVEDLVRIQVKSLLGELFKGLGLGGDAQKTGADKIAQQAQGIADAAAKVKLSVTVSGVQLSTGIKTASATAATAIILGGKDIRDALGSVADEIRAGGGPANQNIAQVAIAGVEDFGGISQLFEPVAMSGANDLEAVLQDFSGDMGSVTDKAIRDMTTNFDTLNFGFKDIFSSISGILDGSSDLFKGGGFFGGLTSGEGGGFFSDLGAGLGGGGFFDFLGFAKGGVLKDGGSARLSKFAEGGIATDPTLAMFGEGDRAEAFVPLPDGRRIPVEMSGPPNRVVNLTTNMTIITEDATSFGRNQDQIARRAGLTFQRALARDN